jgi:hypothetical protein
MNRTIEHEPHTRRNSKTSNARNDATTQRRNAVAAKLGLPGVDSLNMWPMLSGENTTSPRTEWLLTPVGDPAHAKPGGGWVGGAFFFQNLLLVCAAV